MTEGGVADAADHWPPALDAVTEGWVTKASLPNHRNHLGTVALDGRMHAIEGQHGERDALVTRLQRFS
jgi:hypothetical protein